MSVHNKVRTKEEYIQFYCNSPVYDPETEAKYANSLTPRSYVAID